MCQLSRRWDTVFNSLMGIIDGIYSMLWVLVLINGTTYAPDINFAIDMGEDDACWDIQYGFGWKQHQTNACFENIYNTTSIKANLVHPPNIAH